MTMRLQLALIDLHERAVSSRPARMIRGVVLQIVGCVLIAGLAIGQASAPKPAFEAFGLRSGMTPDEVSKEFPNYELRWLVQPHGVAFLAKRPVDPDNPDTYASLSFCKNRLFAVVRTVDPDTDFLAYMQDYLREYGQPKVNVLKEPWTGPNGGDITSFDLVWVRDGVRREVSLTPEGRTGSGELRYVRTASVAVHFDTPCR